MFFAPESNDPKSNHPESNDPESNDSECNDPQSNDPESNDPESNDPESSEPQRQLIPKVIRVVTFEILWHLIYGMFMKIMPGDGTLL